jgi:hypothetical protein
MDRPARPVSPVSPVSPVRPVHQVVRSRDELEPHERESQRLLWEHNPAMMYTLWDDASLRALVADHWPAGLAVWDGLLGIQRADLGRYVVLWVHGGVYCDTDLYVARPFADMGLDESAIYLAPSTPDMVGWPAGLTNYMMASPAGHPFWRSVLSDSLRALRRWTDRSSILYVGRTTGKALLRAVARRTGTAVRALPGVVNMHCGHTDAAGAWAVHVGSMYLSKRRPWVANAAVAASMAECRARAALGVRGNLCQFPVVLAVLAALAALAATATVFAVRRSGHAKRCGAR